MRTFMRFLVLILALAFLSNYAVVAAEGPVRIFRSSERRVALLELYTSEGCNSCPPAEEWLTRQKESPELWRGFVPVAFHVDYWDSLGWPDPWAAKANTTRQEAYQNEWQAQSIYTPEFVLNGKEWQGWLRGAGRLPPATGNAGVLEVSSTNATRWDARFTPVDQRPGKYQVCAALLDSGLISDVKAGENEGMRLHHDFVVLKMVQASLTAKEHVWTGGFTLATPGKAKGRPALAVWVTREGSLEPFQATGGWLAAK
jgi:hypothetical protein